MTVPFGHGHHLDESPTYSHGTAPTTPRLSCHGFAASRHHVAAQVVDMAGYDEPSVNAQTGQTSADCQQREDSYSPEDTPTKRQKTRHSSPGPQHACMIASPTSEAPYAGLPQSPALLAAPSDASDGHFDMLPPPDSVHPSWQALHEYAQSHASEHGYALSINTTAKNRSRIKLACVCYGQPKNTHKLTDETRVRKNRVSYKTGCKMWVEGKKLDDGTWLLRVGEPQHNHPGRESAGWAVQRKRTWGLVGGRIGVGGVTAKEELAKMNLCETRETQSDGDAEAEADDYTAQASQPELSQKPATHSLERGGLVWRIVEQEMLRKGEPNHGRDRGVGRTVGVLQATLPGIHILKRDVYNIRAQIKRARKASGQPLGHGFQKPTDDIQPQDEVPMAMHTESNYTSPRHERSTLAHDESPPITTNTYNADAYASPCRLSRTNSTPPAQSTSYIDPSLDSTNNPNPNLDSNKNNNINTSSSSSPSPPSPAHPALSPTPQPVPVPSPPPTNTNTNTTPELDRLRRENSELKRLLAEKTKEARDKAREMAGLKSQVELLSNMVLTSGRGVVAG
ncbi:Transcription factor rbf1 (RPG-box-binding factor) (Repressor-activator protein 1) [Exserohilum turcicum]